METVHGEVIGTSAHSAAIRRFVREMASSHAPCLLVGEPGVGKELLARKMHMDSGRSSQPFLMVDCSLYYERELKRELLGYRGIGKAAKSRRGLLEFASLGSCYLSRIEELSSKLQQDLLDFIKTGRFRRLGDGREIASGVRLIVSSEKDIAGFVAGGLFNESLFEELSRRMFTVLPLRERAEDVVEVVRFLTETFRSEHGLLEMPVFSREALDALTCFPWPKNHDGLRDEVLRVLRSGIRRITPEQLSLEISSYWVGRRGDPEIRKALEELDGYMREFKILSRLDAELGDVLIDLDDDPAEWSVGMATQWERL